MYLHRCPRWHVLGDLSPVSAEQLEAYQNHEVFGIREVSLTELGAKGVHVSLVTLIFGTVIHIVGNLE